MKWNEKKVSIKYIFFDINNLKVILKNALYVIRYIYVSLWLRLSGGESQNEEVKVSTEELAIRRKKSGKWEEG